MWFVSRPRRGAKRTCAVIVPQCHAPGYRCRPESGVARSDDARVVGLVDNPTAEPADGAIPARR